MLNEVTTKIHEKQRDIYEKYFQKTDGTCVVYKFEGLWNTIHG